MSLLSFVYFLVVLLTLLSGTSGCDLISEDKYLLTTICPESNSSERYIEIAGRHVPLGSSDMRIKLKTLSRQASYLCDGKLGIISWRWKKWGNQIRVNYLNDTIDINVYYCYGLNDYPERADIRRCVDETTKYCHYAYDTNCVFEVKPYRFKGYTAEHAVLLSKKAGANVQEKVKASHGLYLSYPNSRERVPIETFSVDDLSYIIIPHGYAFCSIIEVYSVQDDSSATGFKWTCSYNPTFLQTSQPFERCTNTTQQCDNNSPWQCAPRNNANTDQLQPTSGIRKTSAEAQPVAMLFALCMIVSSNLANCIG
jgi:hypothetical protein